MSVDVFTVLCPNAPINVRLCDHPIKFNPTPVGSSCLARLILKSEELFCGVILPEYISCQQALQFLDIRTLKLFLTALSNLKFNWIRDELMKVA